MNLSPCGIPCENCTLKGCEGCHNIQGKPFYLKDFGVDVCPLYDCPVNKKGYITCAECADLPCRLFYDWKDPGMTDEQHIQSINDRVNALKASLRLN